MAETTVEHRSTIAEFVKAACRLRREIVGRNSDVRYVDGGGRIFYVLDSGVVKALTNPTEVGPRGARGENGAGYIFPGDETDSEAQARVCAALADYVCHQLTATQLLYQMPTHAQETTRVYRAVARNVQERTALRDMEKFVASLDLSSSRAVRDMSSDRRLQDLLQLFAGEVRSLERRTTTSSASLQIAAMFSDRISEVVNHRNALDVEFINYLNTVAKRGMLPLQEAAKRRLVENNARETARAMEAATLDGMSFSEVADYHRLADLWLARIGYVKRSHGRLDNNWDDAQAMAALAIVNARLRSLGDSTKVVLITADAALIEAACRKMPFNEKSDFGSQYFDDFAYRHVRHHTAFLAECLVEEGTSGSKIVTWLDGFLGLIAKETSFDLDVLVRTAYDSTAEDAVMQGYLRASNQVEPELATITSQWERIRDSATATELYKSHLERRSGVSSAITEALERAANFGQSGMEDLAHTIAKVADATEQHMWEAFVLNLTQAGADAMLASETDTGRNPPDIRFDSLPNTAAIFDNLMKRGHYRNDGASFNEDLRRVQADTADDTPGNNAWGYLVYLITAAVFAKNSKWSVALSLATRAIAIVEERSPSELPIIVRSSESHISGREAYYLAAVASRLTASSPGDLKRSARYLTCARGALEEDHAHGTAMRITGLRFDTERLASALAQYYLARFTGMAKNRDEMLAQARAGLLADMTALMEHLDAKDGAAIRNATRVNAATNLVQCAVISAIWEPGLFPNEGRLSKEVNVLERLTTADDKLPGISRSYLMKAYLMCGKVLTGDRSQAIYSDVTLLADANIRKFSVTHYDTWRYEVLRDFCGARLGRHR